MDLEVFRQELITTLEIDLEQVKNTPVLDAAFLTEIRDSMNYLAETAQTIRDNLPK